MPNKPAKHLKAVTWRLDAELLAAVHAEAERQGIATVALVARALRRETTNAVYVATTKT